MRLKCDDTLVMFTDGVVETPDADDQEFGEERLVDFLRQHSAAPAAALVTDIVHEVQRYSRAAPGTI